MKKRVHAVALGTALLMFGVAAKAAPAGVAESEDGMGVGLSLKVGTLGLGGDLMLGLNRYVGLRGTVNGFSYRPKYTSEDSDIRGDIDWLTYGALLDLFPAGGGFRISGGALVNNNEVKLKANLTRTVKLDGRHFYLDELSGRVEWPALAPYLGIGYGNAAGRDGRWGFACDFGVMMQGEPDVDAKAKASDPALQPIVDQALDNEVKDVEDALGLLRLYPVISVGLSFRF